jgi:hypothetical protein
MIFLNTICLTVATVHSPEKLKMSKIFYYIISGKCHAAKVRQTMLRNIITN